MHFESELRRAPDFIWERNAVAPEPQWRKPPLYPLSDEAHAGGVAPTGAAGL
jgi:hypothetical protein